MLAWYQHRVRFIRILMCRMMCISGSLPDTPVSADRSWDMSDPELLCLMERIF